MAHSRNCAKRNVQSLEELFVKVRSETLREVRVEGLVKLLVEMAACVQTPDVAHSGCLRRELLLLLERLNTKAPRVGVKERAMWMEEERSSLAARLVIKLREVEHLLDGGLIARLELREVARLQALSPRLALHVEQHLRERNSSVA